MAELVVQSEQPLVTAARLLAGALNRAHERRGSARLAVAGGSAQHAAPLARDLAPEAWSQLSLTWVDERLVPPTHPDSNQGQLLAALGGDYGVAHVLPLVSDPSAWRDELAAIDAALEQRFDGALDVTLLGMGADGHIASLFPGHPVEAHGRVAYVNHSPKPPPERITLTREMIASAARGILVVSGEDKRAALERVLRGDPSLPASGLPGLVVITDLPGIEYSAGDDA